MTWTIAVIVAVAVVVAVVTGIKKSRYRKEVERAKGSRWATWRDEPADSIFSGDGDDD